MDSTTPDIIERIVNLHCILCDQNSALQIKRAKSTWDLKLGLYTASHASLATGLEQLRVALARDAHQRLEDLQNALAT